MGIDFIVKGFIIGLVLAVPIGPMCLLCIKRSLARGYLSGFTTGIGVAAADALFGLIVAFGLTAISAFLVSQSAIIRTIGILFLLYLGVKTMLEKIEKKEKNQSSTTYLKDCVSGFFLTLSNPMTVLSFVAILAGTGFHDLTIISSVFFILGIFLGSLAWWTLLSAVAGSFKNILNVPVLTWIHRISGAGILVFALILLFYY